MKKNCIYAFFTIFIWATMASVVKLLLTDIPNMEALSVSSIVAFLFLLIVNIKSGTIKQMSSYLVKDYFAMAGLGFLGLFLYDGLYGFT